MEETTKKKLKFYSGIGIFVAGVLSLGLNAYLGFILLCTGVYLAGSN